MSTSTLSMQIFEEDSYDGQKELDLLLQLLDKAIIELRFNGHSLQKSPEIEIA